MELRAKPMLSEEKSNESLLDLYTWWLDMAFFFSFDFTALSLLK